MEGFDTVVKELITHGSHIEAKEFQVSSPITPVSL
jgi:hypothetical protein